MPSNLTSAQRLPGFYSWVDYNTIGAGVEPSLRTLIWGIASSTAQQPLNMPFLPASQQEADDGVGVDSELASFYKAAISQPESVGCEVWVMPIAEPSGGVASIYTVKVVIPATNPTKSGTLAFWINCRKVEVGFTTADTATTIGDALVDALNALNNDFPLGTCSNAAGVVSIPYKHKGATGEDLPMRCNISPGGSGVNLAAATLVFATNAAGAGSVRVSTGALSVSTTLANADTPAIIAAAVAASWNAEGAYPLSGVVDAVTTTVHLCFRNDRDVRRVSAAIIGSTGTTVNLGSGVTDGLGSSSSLSYNGTLGTGTPTLTGALANLAGLGTFRAWAAPWLDSTTVGTLATNIEASSDGSITGQKQQCLTIVDYRGASTAGAIATASSPNLTTSAPHYAIGRAEDASVRGMDLAVRIAVARTAKFLDAPQFNWNGFQLRGNEQAPILLPAKTPSATTQNVDLRTYALAPIIAGPSGNMEVVKGRTTSLSNDKRLHSWSAEAQAAYHAVDLPSFLRSRFQGGSIIRFSEPRAPRIFDTASVKKAVQERMRFWEGQGNYDGADAMADFVDVQIHPLNPNRFTIKLPESPVADLDQIDATHSFAAPSA